MNTLLEAVDILTTLLINGVQDFTILQKIANMISQARATNTDLTSAQIGSIRTLRDEALHALDADIAQKENVTG